MPRSSVASAASILLVLLHPDFATAWLQPLSATLRRTPRFIVRSLHAKSSALDENGVPILGGVDNFEQWFASAPGASCTDSIQHEDFDGLRGLEFSGSTIEIDKSLLAVPRSVVLQSDFTNADWDADLATQLWKEYKEGKSSTVSGYCDLLTRQQPDSAVTEVPPSTAPDALRQWKDDEKEILKSSPAGQRLLDLETQQAGMWKAKYDKLDSLTKSTMTRDQFEWAMEVVHSRAFCGEFGIGSSPIPPIVSAVMPLLVAIAGCVYFFKFLGDDLAVYLGLGALAAIPAIVNLVASSPPAAVLLPMIDSANHKEDAGSSIDYNPLADSFTLTADKTCLVDESVGKKQLYISYGKKKDTELILNYGFLENIPTAGLSGSNSNAYRKVLAETFLARNS